MCFIFKSDNKGTPQVIELHVDENLDAEKIAIFMDVIQAGNFKRAEYLVLAHMIMSLIDRVNAEEGVTVESCTDATGGVSTFTRGLPDEGQKLLTAGGPDPTVN